MFSPSQVSIIFDDSVNSLSFYRKPGPKKAYVIEHEVQGRIHNVEIGDIGELKQLRAAIDEAIAFEDSLQYNVVEKIRDLTTPGPEYQGGTSTAQD